MVGPKNLEGPKWSEMGNPYKWPCNINGFHRNKHYTYRSYFTPFRASEAHFMGEALLWGISEASGSLTKP